MLPIMTILTPYAIPLLFTGILALAFSAYSLARPKVLASRPFAWMCFCIACWALGATVQHSTNDYATALTATKLQQIGYVGIAPFWLVFALLFTGRDAWLTRARLLAIFIGPIIMLALFWTNDVHELMFTPIYVPENEVGFIFESTFNVMFWVHTAIAYVLIVSGSAFLLNYAFRSDRFYRSQVITLVVAAVVPFVANAVSIFQLNPFPIDLTSPAFGVSLILFALNVFRFKFFDLVPFTYTKLFATLKAGVIFLDEQNRIVQINAAALDVLNQTAAKYVIGLHVSDLLSRYAEQIKPLLEKDEVDSEVKIEPPTGASRWFAVQVSPIFETVRGTPHLRGKLVVLNEVTARKMNELALAHARDEALRLDQFKTQLLSKISHDFRTPLSSIQGYADLLLNGLLADNPDKQTNALQSIGESAVYLNQLVNQLLDKSELNTGRIILKREKMSPAAQAKSAVDALAILAEVKGLELSVDVSPELPTMLIGDSDRVQQILINLINNAIKFTQVGGVHVRFFCVGSDQWGFSVQDTGTGIPEAMQSVIFSPFQQLENADHLKSRERGFGLGLSIVRDLVSLMNGTVQIVSQIGQGSTFTVTLPIVPVLEDALVDESIARIDR